jgi:sugar O-acyltransferase (sialic acid O-acetyltransferase NeuD family)
VAKLVIYGAADFARLALWYFRRDSEHTVVAFTVDGAYRKSDSYLGLPLVDFAHVTEQFGPSDHQMFVAVGYSGINAARMRAYEAAKAKAYTLASYISSRSMYLSEDPPGENAFILEHCTVQPFVQIGANVTMWTGSSIAHDSRIEDHCFLASQVAVSGFVHIGERCFLGANATIRDRVRLAERTLVGAGAVITSDTEAGGVYAPARSVRLRRPSGEFDI